MKLWTLGGSSLLLLVAACFPSVPATNPYDSETPIDQQQRAQVAGLVAEGGAPVEGAEVSLAGGSVALPVTTAADGAFLFADLVPGAYTLVVEHAAYLPTVRAFILSPGEELELTVELTLLPSGTGTSGHLSGVIVKQGQSDHSGVTVELPGTGIRTFTNAAGQFDLFLNPGVYDVSLSATSYRTEDVLGVNVAAGTVTTLPGSPLVLDANPGSISGVVTREGQTDHSLVQIEVLEASVEGTSLADGSYTVANLPAGSYTVVASYPDFDARLFTGIAVTGGQDTVIPSFELALSRGHLSGLVTLEGETSHEGTVVEVVGEGSTAVTNVAGAFTLRDVPVGTYAVTARKDGFLAGTVPTATVLSGQTASLTPLVLSINPGTVTGSFYREDGGTGGHAGIDLTLAGPVTRAGSTAADGSFTFASVPAGAYTLEASAGGYATVRLLGVVVTAGATVDTGASTLALPRGDLSGRVVLDGGSGDVLEVIVRIAGTSFVTTPDASGNYQLNDVPAGTSYVVTARLDGYSTASITGVVVTAGGQSSLADLTLTEQSGDFTIVEAPYTRSTTVNLVLDNPAATELKIGESPDLTAVTPIQYTPTPSYNLVDTSDGPKTLYVQYIEGTTPSAVFSASVVLDRTPPAVTAVSLDGGAAFTNSAARLTVASLLVDDATSGLSEMKLSVDTDFTDDAPAPFSATSNFILASGAQGVKSCYALFKDRAGNTTAADGVAFTGVQAGAAFDTIEWDTVTPSLTGVELGCNGVSPATHCNTPFVTVTLAPAVQEATAAMAFSNTGTFAGATFVPFDELSTWLLTPGDGTKTVSVKLQDAAGNADATGEGFGSIVLDTQAPTLSVTLRGSDRLGPSTTLTRTPTVSVLVTAADETTGATSLEMRLAPYSNFTSDGVTPVTFGAYAAQTDNVSLGDVSVDGLKRLFVQVRDEAGNVTTAEGSITYDGTRPQLAGASFAADVTSATTASLSINASGATFMRLTGDLAGGGSWVSFSSPVVVTLANTNADNSVTVEVSDDAGNTPATGSVSAVIYRDTTAPQTPLLTLAGGAPYTTTTAVVLELDTTDAGTGYGVEEIAIQEGASIDCGTVDYQPYVPLLAWQLSAGDGAKTLFACFKDAAGNTSSDSDGITLDGTAPIDVSLTVNGALGDGTASTSTTSTPSVSYTIGGTDGTGSGLAQMWLSFSPSFATGTWELYGTSKLGQTLSPASGTQNVTVYLRVRDNAGNVTESSGSILLDTEAPVAGALVPQASYVTGATVDLALTTSGATQMCFFGAGVSGGSTDACAANGWETVAASKRVDLTAGDGDKVVGAKFRDAARNTITASSLTIVRDGTEPVITAATLTLTGTAATGSSTSVTRVANVSVALGGYSDVTAGVTEMLVSESTGFSGAVWQPVTSPFQWVLSGGDGTKELHVRLRDAAGNTTTGYVTGTITLDQTAPTGVTLALDDLDDDDDESTRSTSLSATISALDATEVCLLGSLTSGSTDGCLTSGWSTYATSKPLTLTATQGSKPIALFARDLAGNVAAAATDAIFLDTQDPGATSILSVTPYTTSVFLDLATAADAGGSGVVGYEVDYRVVGGATWATVSFDSAQGTITGLAAPRVYQFVARAVDRAGRESVGSGQVDRLVGLSTSIVEGFEHVGAVGDRVMSARGLVLFPRMPRTSELLLLSCDARRGRCTDSGMVESALPVTSLGCQPAASGAAYADVAVTQQGRDVWLFGACWKSGGASYQTFALRSPKDPNELQELDQGSSPLTDLDMWRLVDLGSTAVTPSFNNSASAAANGQALAFAYFENSQTPVLKMRLCRASDDCTNAGLWSTLTFGGLAAADRPTAYTDLDAGKARLWFAYGSQAPAVRVFGCDATSSSCTADANWTRVTLPNAGLAEVYSVRVLEVRDTLYVASLQRGASGPGVFLWTCATSSGCDLASEFVGPVSLSATPIAGPKAVVGGQERTPRLSLDWSSGYLSYASTDYLVGEVTYARCKLTTGCATIGDWTPVTVLETSTVEGQADLTSVAGNPMLFVGRDTSRAYILEPYTPSPVGRALLPDLETGGMRAYLTPRDTSSSDGYVASYNVTSFDDAFASEVLALNPNTENFAVTSSDTPIFGSLRSFRGSDLSFADPYYFGRAASPRELATAYPEFPRYEKTGQCHVSLYVTGTAVRAEACLLGGTCAAAGDWQGIDVITLGYAGATGLASSVDGSTLWVAVSGRLATAPDNDNLRYTSVAVNADCSFGTPATARDVFAASQVTMPYAPVLAVSPADLYLAYGDPVSASRFARCARASACDSTLDWVAYSFGDSTYHGGDLAVSPGRVFWLGRRNDTMNPDTFLRYCNGPSGCDAPTDWTTISLLHRGPTSGAGSLNVADNYLLWTQEDELAWCELATGCDDAKEWQSGGLTPDYLSTFDARTGVLGRHAGDFVFVGYGLGGIYVSRCPNRCWKSDSWFGGFVGRSAQFGAELWQPLDYNHWGKSAGVDVATGEVTLTYRFLKAGDPPNSPSALRFNTGMKFELSLAP